MKPSPALISARVTLSDVQRGEALFPERSRARLNQGGQTGICLSGGGNRAAAAGLGQLRALHALGLIEDIGYLSCVSGGSWLSAVFTFYRDGAADDAQLLGPLLSAEERRRMRLEDWGVVPAGCFAATASADILGLSERLFFKVPAAELWQNVVGEAFFAPYGLYGGRPRAVCLDAAQVAEILAQNPGSGLTPDDFVTARPGRPYLIVNGSLMWPDTARDPTQLVDVQFTPLAVGNPTQTTLRDPDGERPALVTGGGFVEPFAFGSTGPTAPPADPARPETVWMEMPAPGARFEIWHASGISSFAFGGLLSRLHGLDVTPKVACWPAGQTGQIPAQTQLFGDGGLLDNLGLMPLLQRQVPRIAVFVNTEVPLAPSKAGVQLDPVVTSLFEPSDDFPRNQVLRNQDGELAALGLGLWQASQAGGPAIWSQTYQTIDNEFFGIKAYAVEILFVYNALVGDWLSELSEEVAAQVRAGAAGEGPLKGFPLYSTFDEDGLGHLVELTATQALLLADMMAAGLTQEGPARALTALLGPRG